MTGVTEEKKPHIFEESTQYQHWRFSPEQLWDIRNKSTEAAIDRVKRNNEHAENKIDDKREYLSAKEELALCSFYEMQLQIMSKHCKFSDMVMATAVVYMKRFFLYNTVMDYHPKDIFLTCLFLATKSESERISIDDFGKNLRLPSTANVLKLEFTVSQGLKFQYYVHHPYRPAYGFFLDMQTGPTDIKLLKETYRKVDRAIADILLTDLPLIYQPSQLALAAFIIAGKDNGFDSQVSRYIKSRFNEQDAAALLSIIDSILDFFKAVPPKVTQEEARNIDYKLRLCMNPAMNPESTM
ncbi:cyclin-like protein [Gilbertella persicaria]|uniref:cyclin-like protein n=1 Tax=Gilbertella persicaria TaxID=101096 RepID=UPI00221F2DD6|nr:cyclin-like protein [Gilbertella persicaria]KAI8080117.1 cyclin-like protein [Gilbertella persicaria]